VIAHVDRIAVIHDGKLKAEGPPEELVMKLSLFGIRPPCYAIFGKERLSWLSE